MVCWTVHITKNLVVLAAHISPRRGDDVALVDLESRCSSSYSPRREFSLQGSSAGKSRRWTSFCPCNSRYFAVFSELRCCRSGRKRQCAEPVHRRHARRLSDGCAKRAVRDLARWRTVDRGADNKILRYSQHIGETTPGQDPSLIAKARQRARRTWPAVRRVSFGCALGAWCEASLRPERPRRTGGFALLALILGISSKPTITAS